MVNRVQVELVETSGVSLKNLRTKAAESLNQFTPQFGTVDQQPVKGKKSKKSKVTDGDRSLTRTLFEAYSNTEDQLTLNLLTVTNN